MIKVIFLGINSVYSILPLLAIRNLCKIEAVFTPVNSPGLRDKLKSISGYKSSGAYSLIKTCKTYGINYIETTAINSQDSVKLAANLNADFILISGYNEILKREFINTANKDVFNAHSSLLPHYRGAHPFFSMVKNAEKKGGCTIHRVTEKFDDGEILFKNEFDIYDGMNLLVYNTLAGAAAARGFSEILQKIKNGEDITSEKNMHKGLPVAFNPIANDFILGHTLSVKVFLWMFNAYSDTYPLSITDGGRNRILQSVSAIPIDNHLPYSVQDGVVYILTK